MLAVPENNGLPLGKLKALLKTVKTVPTPLLVTITTEKDSVIFSNMPMRSLSPGDRAQLYVLLNASLIEDLACLGS